MDCVFKMNHIQYFSLIFLILKGNDFICIGLIYISINLWHGNNLIKNGKTQVPDWVRTIFFHHHEHGKLYIILIKIINLISTDFMHFAFTSENGLFLCSFADFLFFLHIELLIKFHFNLKMKKINGKSLIKFFHSSTSLNWTSMWYFVTNFLC